MSPTVRPASSTTRASAGSARATRPRHHVVVEAHEALEHGEDRA
jgi:hypothetical protein